MRYWSDMKALRMSERPKSIEMLNKVGIPELKGGFMNPHQFSGGMRQRI